MVRIQLQLDEKTYDAVRDKAHREHKSMSAIVREILHKHIGSQHDAGGVRNKSFSFVSSGASGRKDISVNHDEALAEDFR